jgi:hypothetical protein
MGVLVFICPTSGHEVATGLEIDPASYKRLQKESTEIRCSDCGQTHNLFQIEARLVDNNLESIWGTRQTQPVTATYRGRA